MLKLRWFGRPMERRAGRRKDGSPLTAMYWTGAAPEPRKVRNIDANGAFIESAEPWRPGTMLYIAMEPEPEGQGQASHLPTFGLWARIVRSEADGMAVQFVFDNRAGRKRFQNFLAASRVEAKAMNGKEAGAGGESGQALVECALVLPIMFLLILNVVNFGAFLYSWITVANAARSGAQYMIIGGAMVTAPSTPTEDRVAALVRNDLAALPNASTLAQVRVCSNNPFRTPVVKCSGAGTTLDPPPDPEPGPSAGVPAPYVLGTVDVTYTYRPLVPLAYLTLPPATIQQRSAMRFLQ